MATMKQALAAVRRKHGKSGWVRENKNALTPAQREDRQSHVNLLNERVKQIDAELKAKPNDWIALLKAAEFCRDVNAQEPSLSQLGEAATAARAYVDLQDERKLVAAEAKKLSAGLHRQRWDAGHVFTIPGLGQGLGVDWSADTLDELLAKIGGQKATV